MKLNYYYTIILVAIFQFSDGQNMPIDFTDTQDQFIPFAGSGFALTVDPQNPNDEVGQFYNDGTDIWQGFYIDLNQPLDLSVEQQITLDFYQFDPNAHTIILKLENGTGPVVEVQQTTSASGWDNDILFDFADAVVTGVGTNINATGSYSRLVILIDGGVATPGTYLIDDIDDGSDPGDPHALDVIYTDLVWGDEFESTTPEAIDGTKWYHQTFGPNGGQWFNGEQQHYTDRIDNSYIENGNLNIVAKAENFTQDEISLNYTSARLNSKFAFTYGRVDVRAKLPFGEGTWPAIWTLGKNITESGAYWETQGFGTTGWPACGEIDIMEHGLGATNHVSSALHTPSSFGATINYQSYILNDVANNFHVYSMNWSPNQITFLIDDVGYYTYNPAVKDSDTWPFDEDQYILLNIAMGGIAGAIDGNFTESSMVIDYVRVYQNSILGIDDVFANKFSIYPNPSSSIVNIKSNEPIDRVELYNTLGQLVVLEQKNIKQLNLQKVEAGIYLLKIYSGNKTVSKKIVRD